MKRVRQLLAGLVCLAWIAAAPAQGEAPLPAGPAAAQAPDGDAVDPPPDPDAAIHYKEDDAVSTRQLTTGYVVLIVFLLLAIALLALLRKYLAHGLSPPRGERLALLEKLRIGRQTHATLLEVEGRKILVVENPHGLAVNRLHTQAHDGTS